MGKEQSKSAERVEVVSAYPRDDSLLPTSASETHTSASESYTSESYTSTSGTHTSSSENMSSNEYVCCSVEELKDGEMKDVELADRRKALVVREGETFYAIGSKCSHFGASLKTGVLCNGRVRCPWHGACFDIKTGDIEDFPGLDSIPKFEVFVKDGKIIVKDNESTGFKRAKPMVKASSDNKQIFVLIGGGPASVNCAQTLRQEGFTGRVVLVTDEKCLPYDRTKLSKAMTSKAEQIALRDEAFYKSGDIEIMTGKEVVRVDSKNKSLAFKDGGTLKYTSLMIATGGKPRVLPIPGIDLENICLLRTPEEANKISADAAGKNVVILGSSFIGLEVAAFMTNQQTSSLTVIGRSSVPLQVVLGKQVGSVYKKLHEDKGVKFYFENSIQEFVGENGKVKEVLLKDGKRLPADICILGTGVVPATDFLKGSGINVTKRGFITVDKCLKTNVAGVFAAGDIVEFPLFMAGDAVSNVQHWQMASMHGRIAALNMNGKKSELHSVPYFWTQQYGKSIRYAGYGAGFDDVVVHGDLDAFKFAAFYTKGDNVIAVASMGMDPLVSQAAELMNLDQVIKKSEIKDDPQSWVHRLKLSSHV